MTPKMQAVFFKKPLTILALTLAMLAGLASLSLALHAPNKPVDLRIAFEAQKSDVNGIDKSTIFTLKTSRSLSVAKIKQELKFNPPLDFAVKEKKFLHIFPVMNFLADSQFANTYDIIPAASLTEGVVYKVETATSSDIKLDHDYAWAFKVKESFSVRDSIPADKATGVPLNTGIELTFNRLAIGQDAGNYFTIEPASKGRFEVGINKLTFVPEGDLQEKTLYKITIKKGYRSGEKNEALAEDKTIAFETTAKESAQGEPSLTWNTDYSEMTPDRAGFLEANGNATSSELTVYRYSQAEDFLHDYHSYENRYANWSTFNQATFAQSAQAQAIFNFKPELLKQAGSDYYGLIKLPRNLVAGAYIFKLTVGQNSTYSFARVSPLAYYYSVINGDGLIWAYDFVNKRPFANIKASFRDNKGGEKELGTTDQNGLVKFDSSSSKTGYEDNRDISLVFRGEQLNETTVPDIGRVLEQRTNYYQGYLNTDRYAYRLTDKVHFWGVVKGRSFDLREKKVKVTLDGLVEQEVTVSPFDTIEGELDFQGLSSGSHSLTVSYNDETITSSAIEVFAFEKPIYKIEVIPTKNFSLTGQPVTAKVKVSFFDETPVKNMDLTYSIDWQQTATGTLKTNDQGEAEITYQPDYYFTQTSDLYSDSWTTYPMSLRFTVRPALAEEANIWGETYVNIYGPQITMQSKAKEKGQSIIFQAKVNRLNLATSSEGGIIGQPAVNQPVKVQIFKYYYEQTLDGETYDPIEKVKVKNFRYETKKILIKEVSGSTDQQGELQISLDKKELKGMSFLKAVFTADDETGKRVMSSSQSYDYSPQNGNSSLNLTNTDLNNNITSYKVGDQVHLHTALTGDQKPVDNHTLIISYQEGLRNAELIEQTDYTATFSSAYVPTMSYLAVRVMPNGFLESQNISASFDKEQKRLNVAIESDKPRYRPREEVNLKIHITDKDKKGAQAIANVGVVDEALFNITPWGYGSDILNNLYADIAANPYSLSTSYVTNFRNGAEKGGCFLAGTNITMSDESQKKIEELRVGDEITTFSNEQSTTKAKSIIQGVSAHDVKGYLLINDKLKVTPEHKLYLSGRWQLAGQAKIGDYLLNAQHQSETISDIQYVEGKVKVYNIIVGRYHTYLAEGYYVHNAEKGGGGDARNFFEDTPLYHQYEADADGNIKASFRAPDNLTSWRVSVNAYDRQNFQAGGDYKLVPVGLPLFADAVVAKEYLTGDQPVIKLRVFGSDYKSDQPVSFSVESDSLHIKFATTTMSPEIDLPLGTLMAGQYRLNVSIMQGQLKDTLEKTFKVVDNYIRQYQSANQDLNAGTPNLKGNDKGFTDLVFVDAGKGQFFDRLLNLNWRGSSRSDIQAAAFLAAKALNENFYQGKNYFQNELDLSNYQQNDAIVSLLPYSSTNLGLAAELADALPEKLDNSRITTGLTNKLDQLGSSSPEELSQALYGLAALSSSPDLPLMNYLINNASTSLEAKIYLGLAFEKAGDRETARKIYFAHLQPRLIVTNGQAHLNLNADQTRNAKMTALLGILASRLETGPTAETVKQILAYLYNQPPEDDSTALEEAMILKSEIAKQPTSDASFNFQTNSRKGKVNLSQGRSYYLTLGSAELKSLDISDVSGKPQAISYYEASANPGDLAKSRLISVTRTYLVNGHETTNFKEGDLVQVRLDPNFTASAPDEDYQVVDYLPSNLKPITSEYSSDVVADTDCNPIWYPTKTTEEALYFTTGKWFGKTPGCAHRTINYHARVVNKGQFRAQGAVIQSLKNLDLENISAESMISVQ